MAGNEVAEYVLSIWECNHVPWSSPFGQLRFVINDIPSQEIKNIMRLQLDAMALLDISEMSVLG
jgi:hypothetical protein